MSKKSGLNLICDFCGQREKGKGYLQRHFDQKHRNFFCNVCNQVFSQKANLLKHLRTYFERFVCQYCGLEIHRFELFQKHIYEKHEPNNKQLILSIQSKEVYDCRFCIRNFPNPVYRNTHEHNVHKGRSEEAFKCKDCNVIFITKDELRSHSFEHYAGMLHFCTFPECDRFFKNSKQLRNHTFIHGPAKYECEKCNQKFVQCANLSKHKKRCKGKPQEVKNVSKEEQEEISRVAKDQFLQMGGKIKSAARKIKSSEQKRDQVVDPESELVVEYLEEYSDEVKPSLDSTVLQKRDSSALSPANTENKISQEIKLKKPSPDFVQVFVKENNSAESSTTGLRPRNKKKLLICEVCAFTTSSQVGLRNHMKKHKNSFNCCDMKFSKKTEYNKHMRLTHKISWKRRKQVLHCEAFCDICSFSSRSLDDLRKHMKQHLQTKETCDICQKQIRNLAKHMNTHHAAYRFVCSICDAKFRSSSNYKSHVKIHDEPSECPICHKFLPHITRHIKWHSRPKPKPFSCLQCGKICYSKQALGVHIHRVHEKMPLGKSYSCSVCQLSFIRHRDLRRHSFIHYQGKIYNCDVPECNEMFKNRFKLQTHMMVHNSTQEASFQCNFCDKKYLRKTALNKHQKQAHTDLVEAFTMKILK